MDLALGADGDLDVSTGDLRVIDGDDAIVQHCAFRLRFVKGEYFLDDRVGTPYFDKILLKNPDLIAVRSIIRKVINETPGIRNIDSFSLTFDRPSRKASIQASMTKDDGLPLDFSKEFIIT